MTITDVGGAPLSDAEHRRELRKAVIASTVGTTIEWYDFLLYSIVTPSFSANCSFRIRHR